MLFGVEIGGVGVCVASEVAGVRPEVEGGYGSNTWLRKTLGTSGLLSGVCVCVFEGVVGMCILTLLYLFLKVTITMHYRQLILSLIYYYHYYY